jgi:hypothetical protein
VDLRATSYSRPSQTCTRRKFFAQSSQLALLSAAAIPSVGGKSAAAVEAASSDSALPSYTYDIFHRLKDTHFFVSRQTRPSVPLRLVKVEKRKSGPARANAPDTGNEKFSLIFLGPTDKSLPQETYSFHHPQIGTFAMFIVPVSTPRDGKQRFYEAVFNCAPALGASGLAALKTGSSNCYV